MRSGVARLAALVMWRMRDEPPPLSVTLFAPSIVVSPLTGISDVTVMVIGSAPQSNVTIPPEITADRSATSVQLAAEPSPTFVFGFDVSTALAGAVQVARGGGGS